MSLFNIKLSRKDLFRVDAYLLNSYSIRPYISSEHTHNVHGSNCLSLGMLYVRHSIMNDVLKEFFEDAASLLVDESRDMLHFTTTCKTIDSRFGDSLDVVTKNLVMTPGATIFKTLPSFATTRHNEQKTC